MDRSLVLTLAIVLLSACRSVPPSPPSHPTEPTSIDSIDEIADDWIETALAIGRSDLDFVDAYYGPEELRVAAADDTASLHELDLRLATLADRLGRLPGEPDLRRRWLAATLRAARGRVGLLLGRISPFDDETRLLFDTTVPRIDLDAFRDLRARLEVLLPGPEPLEQRVEAFRADFFVPPDRVDATFRRAITECRDRTLERIALPPEESFEVEYVSGRPWSAYNWYKGHYHSLIQVNTELPIPIDRMIGLACHEGYPGHHVFNVLLERDLVRGRGWHELALYPLFNPQSLVAEGSAELGIAVAFPDDERDRFEREVLFPLAGLDPARAPLFHEIEKLLERMKPVEIEIARRWLDDEIDEREALRLLVELDLLAPDRARQRLDFFRRYRSYVINYTWGRDLVTGWLDREVAASGRTPWDVFAGLLSEPRLPSELAAH